MSQNIVQVAGTDNEEKIAERLVEQLHYHADSFGVGINDALVEGLESFFTEVIGEEREESPFDESYDGLTADATDRLASVLQRLAQDIANGDF